MHYVKHFFINSNYSYTKDITLVYTSKMGILKAYITRTDVNSLIEPIKKNVLVYHTGRRLYRVWCKKLALEQEEAV